jgi:competence protein ComFC
VAVLPQIARIKGAALDLLFPRKCVGCGREGEFICTDCLRSVHRIYPPICPLCGRPQPADVLCPDCISWPADIEGIRAPYVFEGVIRETIHQFKYKNLRALDSLLGRLLKEYLASYPLDFDIIVPVPLHSRRLRERGYNQSALLARKLGELMNVPVEETSLTRNRYILPQAKTHSVEERRTNVCGVFSCRRGNLEGKKLLIIDDVSTSGATLNACAGAAKAEGSASVYGLTLAREI